MCLVLSLLQIEAYWEDNCCLALKEKDTNLVQYCSKYLIYIGSRISLWQSSYLSIMYFEVGDILISLVIYNCS